MILKCKENIVKGEIEKMKTKYEAQVSLAISLLFRAANYKPVN